MPENFNFTKAYEEIERINDWFRQEGIDLDEALQNYEKGMKLIELCRQRLKQAENRFQVVKKKYTIEQEVNPQTDQEMEQPFGYPEAQLDQEGTEIPF